MQINFKTLTQETFKIEIEETAKVKTLKEKIAMVKGVDKYPVAGQKLIYAGKILDDEKLISEFNIDPIKNFVVVMNVKPKSKPPEKPKETETSASRSSTSTETASSDKESSESASSTSVSEANSEATTSTSIESTTTTTTPALASQNTTEIAESTLLTGTALESSITELMSLGFSRERVMRALNTSFHNADRAAEYLLSGNIPDLPDLPDDTEEVSTPVTDNPSSNPSAAAGDLSFLRSLPQFQLMRNQVQAHPESLPQLLQEIGRSNPQLLSLISQQQEAFIGLLNEPNPNEGGESGTLESGAQGGGDGSGSIPGSMQIQVTQNERVIIDRLVAMGFEQGDVIQAFFACDKDENLAVEFLLNQ